ncbi:MAG TPA: DUF4230 domain-containing protein [Verrucomicrobiae bacterium]|jgi:hypothetical protein|nr:DUF4230 domain-containing protein [Verrucomicrobiae bacterium]
MANARRVKFVLAVVALFFLGIYFGARLPHLPNLFGSRGAARTFDTPILLQQVQTLSDLVTVKYVVEKVEVWNDPPSGLISQFVAGDNRILLLAHGVVKAGVDVGKLKPADLRIDGKTIWINLPPAHITDAYLDDKETKVVERTTGFMRSFDKDLEQNIRRTAVEDMRQSASRSGILRDADERTRTQLASFFTLMGFERVEFNLRSDSTGGLGARNIEIQGTPNTLQDRAVPQIHSP